MAAEAVDQKDGDLGASVKWYSNIVGELGEGALLSAELLVGDHTITVEVADSDGNVRNASVQVLVVNGEDGDSDNLPDDWEVEIFGNLLISGDQDFDGDGYTNAEEYENGTHPILPNAPSTLDPQKTSAALTLSNGNLTATAGNEPVWRSSFATNPLVQGKNYYWEVSVAHGAGYTLLGIGNVLILDNYLGSESGTYGWNNYGNGRLNYYNGYRSFGDYSEEDRVMLAYNGNSGKLWYGKNGVWYGDPVAGTSEQFSGIVGIQFPAVSLYSGATATLHFATSDLNFTPPQGFELVKNTDVDSDDLEDIWEVEYFRSLSQNGTDDPDGDGMSNSVEQQYELNPTDGIADTDYDTLPDWWEITYFSSLEKNALTDTDGDGKNELEEFLSGSDPTVHPGINKLSQEFASENLAVGADGKTVTMNSNVWNSARAISGLPAGNKYYWEAEVLTTTGYILVGVGSDTPFSHYVGSTPGSYGWHSRSRGQVYNDGVTGELGGYDFGDRIMIAFDPGEGRLWYGLNGVWFGDPEAGTGARFEGVAGEQYPAISAYGGGVGALYFSLADFKFDIPEGFVVSEASD